MICKYKKIISKLKIKYILKENKSTDMTVSNKFSPLIIIDYGNMIITVEGRLIIMNDDDFFHRLEKALYLLDEYELHVDIEYFNTYSFKMLYPMLFHDNVMHIKWYFDIDDEDTVTKGELVRAKLEELEPSKKFSFVKKKNI